jgi:hypothetical protein
LRHDGLGFDDVSPRRRGVAARDLLNEISPGNSPWRRTDVEYREVSTNEFELRFRGQLTHGLNAGIGGQTNDDFSFREGFRIDAVLKSFKKIVYSRIALSFALLRRISISVSSNS